MIPTIDYQRITDLATAIERLTEEEHFLLDTALLDRAVESRKDSCSNIYESQTNLNGSIDLSHCFF